MDGFIDKFNIFDLFTMLIPGIIISALFGVSLSFQYSNRWDGFGNEKYTIFFIFSYMCGVILQEFGTIADEIFLYNIIYGGNPREIFILKDEHKKILNEDLSYEDTLFIKDYFINTVGICNCENLTAENDKDLNSLIYGYCISIAEFNKFSWKSEKMLVISEMSRSLFWGCIATILINMRMINTDPSNYKFYSIEIFFLAIFAVIFMTRKIRYEKYSIKMLLSKSLLFIKDSLNNNKTIIPM